MSDCRSAKLGWGGKKNENVSDISEIKLTFIMKKLFVFLLVNLISMVGWGQTMNAKPADVSRFLSSKCFVVLDADPFSEFNAVIDDYMKQFWKLTPYEIIDAKKFANLRTHSEHSFMFISFAELTQTKTSLFATNTLLFKNKMSSQFTVLNVSMGDKSGNIQKMPEIISIPLAYYFDANDEDDDDFEEPEYAYKLGAILKSISFLVNEKMSNPNINIEKLMDAYSSEIKNYELWFLSSDLPDNLQSVDAILKLYPYKVKIVTEEEIENVIKSNMKNIAILHKIGPEDYPLKDVYCFKTLISCEDGKPLYFDYHMISKSKPDAFLMEDFKKIGK